jgi:hypothetical protein
MTSLADGRLWLRLGQADGSFGDAKVGYRWFAGMHGVRNSKALS